MIRQIENIYIYRDFISIDCVFTFQEVAVGDQDYLLNPTIDNVLTTVNGIVKKLSGIPAALIKFYCNPEDVRFEKYLTPGILQTFEIHKEYIKRGHVTTKVYSILFFSEICIMFTKIKFYVTFCQKVLEIEPFQSFPRSC